MFNKYSILSKNPQKRLVVCMIKFMDRKNSSYNLYHRVASLYLCQTFINSRNKKHASLNTFPSDCTKICVPITLMSFFYTSYDLRVPFTTIKR